MIPTIITQLAGGACDVKLGELTTTRDFTFVEDTCRGLVAVAGVANGAGEVFNIGSNQEIAIGDLVTLIGRVMAVAAVPIADAARLRPAASEVQRLRCDGGKLEQAAGFRPFVSLEEGLARTVAWFRDAANLRQYKPHLYNV